MKKQIEYELNNFAKKPRKLSTSGQLMVPMKSVCHQSYLDWLGSRVPKPNPIFDELCNITTTSPDLEFTRTGLGRNTEARRAQSTKYGKGFCRWFLGRYCGVTHFADIGTIMNRPQNQKYKNVTVSRLTAGDLPDYLCADFANKKIYLGEAKGVQTRSLAFANADFTKWQKQFQRLNVTGVSGNALSLKGFIVATQFRKQNSKWKSKVFCEDPKTEGETPGRDEILDLLDVVVLNHYVSALNKLLLTPEADAILNWYSAQRPKIEVAKYTLLDEKFKRVEFYGRFLGSPLLTYEQRRFWGRLAMRSGIAPLDNWHEGNSQYPVFFGVACKTLKSVIGQARAQPDERTASQIQIPESQYDELSTDLFSYAPDGTLVADGHAMRFVGFEEI